MFRLAARLVSIFFEVMIRTKFIICIVMSSPPVLDESDWVPLTNTFSRNLAKREDQDFSISVSRGTSDTLLSVCFRGGRDCVGGGDGRGDGMETASDGEFELKEEISFDKLTTLHQ